jgi:hypothetical protein
MSFFLALFGRGAMSDLSPLCGHRTSGVQQQTQQLGLKPRADQHQICRARHQQRRDERIVQLFVGGFERRFHGGAKHQAILSLESRGLFLEDSGLVYDSTIHLSYCEPRLGQRVFQGVRVAFKFTVILKEAVSPAPFRNLLRGNNSPTSSERTRKIVQRGRAGRKPGQQRVMPTAPLVWQRLTAIIGSPYNLGVDRQMQVQAGNTELPTGILQIRPRLPG